MSKTRSTAAVNTTVALVLTLAAGSALAGVVFALFMVYVPTIIDSIMTAVI